ncbi:GGDEF domain-containing protein [Pigmentiphaga aceris]|uniref:diguanylate cyclase n=1 Tax=Pigmentiphaga aceris TaxID=1940612 RepID=A0A5C0AX54_9BURK|nr:GGDEF domain-containing protein [Pigmentiphaga aceris]QEI05420.1 GGDEF domain-containing protein [Pigmentiphaga aceris]
MLLDVRTLYVATAAIAVALGMVQLLACVTQRFPSWVAWWGASNLLVGLGVLFLSQRGVAPDWVSVPLSNLLMTVGYGLLLVGMRRFVARKVYWPLHAVVTVLILGLVIVLWPALSDFRQRAALIAGLACACDLWIAIDAMRTARRERLLSARVVGALFGFTSLLFGIRVVTMIGDLYGYREWFPIDSPSVLLGLTAVMLLPVRNMALILMANERYRNDWRMRALRDPLTSVPNRAGIRAAFEGLENRSIGMSLLMVDLDHFKDVNDALGHEAGDRVLLGFVAIARGGLRYTDVLGRYGGDEFVILLPETSLADAQALAERLRHAFADGMRGAHLAMTPTLSIGIAGGQGKAVKLDVLLSEADKALYLAKRNGRNCLYAAA